MYMHWMNTMVGYCGPFKYESEYCQKLRDYLEANLAWMEEQMAKGQDPEYWHQVRMGNPHPGNPLGSSWASHPEESTGQPAVLAELQVG